MQKPKKTSEELPGSDTHLRLAEKIIDQNKDILKINGMLMEYLSKPQMHFDVPQFVVTKQD